MLQRIRLQELDELEWRSPDNLEVAAAGLVDPTGAPAQQQQGGANNNNKNNITNGSVTSVAEISNAVSGDAGPDSRGFPASSFPDVNASSPEMAAAEMSDSAVAAAAEGGPVTGLNGEGGGAGGAAAEALAAGSEVAGDAGEGDAGSVGDGEEKDETPPFLEEFEEVELQVRAVRLGFGWPSRICGLWLLCAQRSKRVERKLLLRTC